MSRAALRHSTSRKVFCPGVSCIQTVEFFHFSSVEPGVGLSDPYVSNSGHSMIPLSCNSPCQPTSHGRLSAQDSLSLSVVERWHWPCSRLTTQCLCMLFLIKWCFIWGDSCWMLWCAGCCLARDSSAGGVFHWVTAVQWCLGGQSCSKHVVLPVWGNMQGLPHSGVKLRWVGRPQDVWPSSNLW